MNLTKRKVRQKRILTDAERLKRRTRRRAVACAMMLPPCVAGAFGLTIGYNIWAGNKAVADTSQFHKMAPPTAAQSLLVFAPHCDDETLGAAGLMRQTLLNKGDVHVAILTNGDGFRVSVAREFRELSVPTKDFIRYAYIRQKEAQTALGVLGVPKSNIQFFGYPDRGLMPMWTTNWSADEPFTSAFTQADHCPYDNSYTPKAAYCGESLLKDIESQMNAVKPTDIYVTHPNDDHPDHAAASVFVRTALEQLRSQGVGWAQHAQLHYYLVHRGDWPVPQGLHEDVGLPPPAQMVSLDTHWEEFPLTKRDTQRKYAAIKRYRTQTELTGRFLYSFVRKNELFGTL
ncbi:MAG: PIG-L family deacetylase, partial [Capsulimonas sp.]|uniref:PIG-L deacetylase family protein n=1 Tax=Capsulimonas sp. TaxID=2494211 RepID=UPI00326766F4